MVAHQARAQAIGLLVAIATATPAAADPLTLPQAVEIGSKRSPELGQMQARTGAAEAVRDQVRREWFPDITLEGAAGLRHLENDARVNAGLSSIDEKPLYATISAEQPLLDFGRRGNETKVQEANLLAAQSDQANAAEQIALQLAKAYLQLQLQQHIVAASQQNVDFHQALASDVTEGVSKGAMSISEQQQANERLETARVQLAQAMNDYAAALNELSLQLGRSDLELAPPPDAGLALPATIDEAVDRARNADPAVKAALARFTAARHGTDRAQSEYFPVVAMRGTYRYGKDFEGYRGQTKDAEGLLVLRWTLFDGGVTAARAREAGYKEDEARFGLAAAERTSELAVRNGWERLQTWRERSRIQNERRNIAGEVLHSYKEQFGIGRRSLLDLLDAQGAVYDASIQSEVAQAGALLAEYSLLAQFRQLNEFLGVADAAVDPGQYGPK